MLSPAYDVGRALDEGRWTGYQKLLVAFTALTIIFDGVDNQLLGIAIPALMREWSAARSVFAPVVSLSLAGMMIGGAVGGVAGDRLGRRVLLLASLALFGTATMGIAAVHGVRALAVLRFVTGLGLGGALPNATALSAEYVPRSRRALAVTMTIVCVPLGASLAGLFAAWALPALGWRGLFILGGILPIVTVAALFRPMPESPRYLARHPARWDELTELLRRMGHTIEESAAFEDSLSSASRSRVAELFSAEFRRDTILLWIAFFSCLVAVYLGFNWLPSVIAGAGLGSLSSTSVGVFNLGGVVGAVSGGFLITRFGSRLMMLGMAAGAAMGSLVLSRMQLDPHMSVLALLAALAVTGGLINALQTTLYALAGYVYPTNIRATGVGGATSIGRTGAVLSGYAGPWALAYNGSSSYFVLMGTAVTVTLVALAGVRRHVE